MSGNDWQPIATAPHDGTHILLGRFVPGDEYDGRIRVDWWQTRLKAGYTGFGHFNPIYWPPTHWMHLPARPSKMTPTDTPKDNQPTPCPECGGYGETISQEFGHFVCLACGGTGVASGSKPTPAPVGGEAERSVEEIAEGVVRAIKLYVHEPRLDVFSAEFQDRHAVVQAVVAALREATAALQRKLDAANAQLGDIVEAFRAVGHETIPLPLDIAVKDALTRLDAAEARNRASIADAELWYGRAYTAQSRIVKLEEQAKENIAALGLMQSRIAELEAAAGEAREKALEEAAAAQPTTAENPDEDAYQRGRFDSIMEYAAAIRAMKASP